MDARPGEYEARGSDVDWEGEWRWHDARWAGNAVFVLGACAVSAVGLMFGTGPGIRVSAVALVLTAFVIWANTRMLNRLRSETGLTHRKLAVVMRLSRREHVPSDPVAREAMVQLLRMQNSKAAGAGWTRPVGAVLLLLVALLQFQLGNVLLSVAALAAGGYLASPFGLVARTEARQKRLEARLVALTADPPPAQD
ncbi:hypothetical protein ACIQM4_17780 [Streptomyces sp. NPDC091272]|uniref:hypothetical protein n=1 Tax=Streptomyces sp. NPDC091272 TaxID=3365981 RepID=UPI0038097E66